MKSFLLDGFMSILKNITRVVADSDLDGLMAAAVLKSSKPELEVHFAHPALIRAGVIDHLIDENTAICDLPFHPDCGLYLDHHMTNKPSEDEESSFLKRGGICHWKDTPSAARAAYELMKEDLDLSHLEEIMPIVDALDSGGISLDDFLEDGPIIRLSRSLSLTNESHMQNVLNQFAAGMKLEEIIESHSQILEDLKNTRKNSQEIVKENLKIVDGLAICDLSESGYRVSGYLVTAIAGPEAIACCVIHGYYGGSIEDANKPALGASFYSNSFRNLPNSYDLSKLATLLDETGGGHANACGCRIQKKFEDGGMLTSEDKEYNLKKWLSLWKRRDELMKIF